jgi:putative peptidoglycan lipid II flippase
VTEPALDASVIDTPGRFARDAALVTACTLLSRLTGFVRVLVAAAVLSNGVLGDTYHAANLVPNLLFELVAGGVVQAVLIPTFVAARRDGGDDLLGRTAGVVVAALTAVLAVIAAVVMALSPLIAHALTALDADASVAHDKLAVMTPMLLVFIPQIVFYGVGMVSTAALAARRRFMAAALAPAMNNLVVITCYLAYRASRHGRPATLHLSPLQFALLAGGTTAAVIAFTAVPGVVLTRQRVPWRPRWEPTHPAIASLRGAIGWAMLSVLGTLAPTAATVVLGYGAEGGVAVFTMTFAFFVLPHALVAVPVATALAPRVADSWQRQRVDETREVIERSAQVVVPLLMLAGAAMMALSWPVARVAASFGQARPPGGYGVIAHTLAVFGCGLLGYGMAFLMMRVLFSTDQVKRAALLVTFAAAVGVAIMAVAAAVMPDDERAAALALGYGATQTISALLLTWRVRQVTGAPSWTSIGRLSLGSFGAAAVSGAAMFAVASRFGTDRLASLAALVVAGGCGLVVFAAAAPWLTGVRVAALRRGIRGS